jgi:hypothetical protein
MAIEQDSVVPLFFYGFSHPGSTGKWLTNKILSQNTKLQGASGSGLSC